MHDGAITNWLAIIGAVSLIYWAWRIGAAVMSRGREELASPSVTPVVAAPTPEPSAIDNDIAVVAGAVAAVTGAHRILHIEAEGRAANWAAEGRWMHQTSHRPHA